MRQVTWDQFNYKNENKTNSFEDMCRTLFLRSTKKSGYDFQYNYNQAGLEFEPVSVNIDGQEKWIGVQCKYFTTENSSTQYGEIYKSIKTAIDYYNNLDYIYIYANSQLKPICKEEEINNKKKKSARIELDRISCNKVKLIWIQKDNILELMKMPKNDDLRRMYFSEEREDDWIKEGISINEKTFLNSSDFFNLKLDDINITELYHKITEYKVNLLLGLAGTGKTMLIKKMYSDLSDVFLEKASGGISEAYLPVLIKLRECINGDLESLLRKRLSDYNINNTEKDCVYIYFFDGLDEVSYNFIGNIVNAIINLKRIQTTKAIVITSRTDTNNLLYLNQHLECKSYRINSLTYADIESIFSLRGLTSKKDKLENMKYYNAEILKDITDIFSVDLLWNIIEDIDNHITKIEIIEYYVNYWISNYSKMIELPLLEPKINSIKEICKEISFCMQKDLLLGIELATVQEIVKKITESSNVQDINNIVHALMDLFFEESANYYSKVISYKHRRFHEYFLYISLDDSFLKHPELLRELHLLSNKDFLINIFMKTSLRKAHKKKDVLKALALRLLEQYLGYSYWHNYKDDLIGIDFAYGSKEPFYSDSSTLIRLIASYDTFTIKEILINDELSIGDCINKKNCLELIELHHRICNDDISEFIFEKYNISKDKLVNHRNYYSYLYIVNRMRSVSIQTIYNHDLTDAKFLHLEVSHMDYVGSSNEMLNSFYNYCLVEDIDFITNLLSDMSKEHVELLSYQALKYSHIICLISDKQKYVDFRKQLISRFEKEEDYYTNSLAIYNFINKNNKSHDQLKAALDKVNDRNYPTWHQNIELHIMLSFLLKDEVNYALWEFKLGVDLFTHLIENLKNPDKILELWIKDIKPFNFVWNNWLKYTYSNMLGTLISYTTFDVIKLKIFLRDLMKYESVIYLPSVYYNVLKYNPKLFYLITNGQIIDKLFTDCISEESTFESSSESFFQFANMYWNFNKEKSYSILMDGLNNEMLRPPYNGDHLMTMIMPGCLYFAYQNYIFTDNEIRDLLDVLYKSLCIIKKTTQIDSPFGCFKWVMKECIGKDDIPSALYSEDEIALYESKKNNKSYYMGSADITKEELIKYYTFSDENVAYNNLDFWIKVIDENYKMDNELNILYECFNKCYPSSYGYAPVIDYIYLPVAALILDERTKNKFLEYSMDHAGEYGFYNLIRAYSVIGRVNEARKCIEFLLHYIEMLLKPISYLSYNSTIIKDNNYFLLDTIYKSNITDWEFNESQCKCVLISNPQIKIIWDDYDEQEVFRESWATQHSDEHAYLCDYNIYNGDTVIKQFSLVSVDGYRAKLPIPRINTNIIKRNDYFLSRIFNNSIESLHMYIISSDLTIE